MPLPGALPSRHSQCGKILRVLDDGRWHSAREIFRSMPEGATIHSRVSELRKTWGFNIEHRTEGPGAAGSLYRLVTPRREDDGTRAGGTPPVVLSSGRDGAPQRGESRSGVSPVPLQLRLTA